MARRYALVIGVGENYEMFGSLPAAVADAEAIAAALRVQGQFEVELVTGLVKQTRLVKAFNKFLEQAAGEEALIYYSGHGFPSRNMFGQTEVFLALSDCEVAMEEGYATKEFNGWPLGGFNQRLAEADFSSLVMLLDCCHSGFLLEKQALQQTFALFKDKDYGLLTACRQLEQAWIEAGAKHSLFTQQVLAGLGEAQADERGVVSVAKLTAYVQEKLKLAGQEPVVFNMGRELAIVDYRSYAPEPKASEECPYQGLKAFTPETRQFFFGREAEVAKILRKLDESNFVAVVGPSGIGKSSVVRAGLVPRLEERGWEILGPMKPGPKPMAELERLFQGTFPERKLSSIYELVEAGQLVEVAQQLSEQLEQQKKTGQRFLLVIDQFEEVFTLTKRVEKGDSEAEQEAARQAQLDTQRKFIAPLLEVGALADSPLAIVVTMRSDFVDAWLATGQPTAVVQEQAVYVGPLQGEALEEAIVEPAKHQGYGFGAGLLPLILADVEAEPNSLPLLEFALTQLWAQRDGEKQRLTAAAYQEMGKLQGGLDAHAEKIYGSLTEAEQDWARRIFLALVRIGKDERDTRQRRTLTDLCAMGEREEAEDIQLVIQALSGIDSRLLAVEREEVDLSHEALMSGWARLADWRQVDREVRHLASKLEDALQDWLNSNKNNDYLPNRGLLKRVSAQESEIKSYLSLIQFLQYQEAQATAENPEILNQSFGKISSDQDIHISTAKI